MAFNRFDPWRALARQVSRDGRAGPPSGSAPRPRYVYDPRAPVEATCGPCSADPPSPCDCAPCAPDTLTRAPSPMYSWPPGDGPLSGPASSTLAFTLASMDTSRTTWLQQLLGDVDITVSGMANGDAFPAWSDGTPAWIPNAHLAADQPGFYQTELRVFDRYAKQFLFFSGGSPEQLEMPQPEWLTNATGNRTFNLTNTYANVLSGDGHITIDLPGSVTGLPSSDLALGNTQPSMMWLINDIDLPYLTPNSVGNTTNFGSFDALAWSPQPDPHTSLTGLAEAGRLPLNFFSTPAPSVIYPTKFGKKTLGHPPNTICNPSDPASAGVSSNPRYSLLATLCFNSASTPAGWPDNPGSTPFPPEPNQPQGGGYLALMPGCSSPRSGIYVAGTVYVACRIGSVPGTGAGCDSVGDFVSVMTAFDPMGVGSVADGYPSLTFIEVLDYASSTAVSPCGAVSKRTRNGYFIDTQMAFDGAGHVYIFGAGAAPSQISVGRVAQAKFSAADFGDNFEVWTGAAWSPWDMRGSGACDVKPAPLSGFPAHTFNKATNFGVAFLPSTPLGPMWVMLFDSGGGVIQCAFLVSADPTAGSWTLLAPPVATNSMFQRIVWDGASAIRGPATPAGKSQKHGNLYMPKILSAMSQEATTARKRVVLYWTVSTLVPYCPHLMVTEFGLKPDPKGQFRAVTEQTTPLPCT